jgi:hypothetical protein
MFLRYAALLCAVDIVIAGGAATISNLAAFGVQIPSPEQFSLGMLYYYGYLGGRIFIDGNKYVVAVQLLALLFGVFSEYRSGIKAGILAMVFATAIPIAHNVGSSQVYSLPEYIKRDKYTHVVVEESSEDKKFSITRQANGSNSPFNVAGKLQAAAPHPIPEKEQACLRRLFVDGRYLYVFPAYEEVIRLGEPPSAYSVPLDRIVSIKATSDKPTCKNAARGENQ